MSKNNLELRTWGDGTIRLAFWDSMHGDDQIYTIKPDGTALLSKHVDGVKQLETVDLVHELRALAEQWERRASAWELFRTVCALHAVWAWQCQKK